ncbi:hypothetical protein [Chamaesiphon sp. OTE_8_metabat_110]|uniref:hypothetical protein n=1 Tax=Chamaesiphon sp. OTE_8_metabat_110 TaxID=2964696 RepID=UPI00286BA74A|nr:hypothetical protein [Chamaesiphon sp. OTE_8_metabat_110]
MRGEPPHKTPPNKKTTRQGKQATFAGEASPAKLAPLFPHFSLRGLINSVRVAARARRVSRRFSETSGSLRSGFPTMEARQDRQADFAP